MKKSFLINLIVVIMCFTLVGCGKTEKEINNENNNTNNQEQENIGQKEEKKEENKEENNNTVVIDDEIIDIDDEDNPPIVEGTVTVSEVINCDGCVFSYFSGEGENAKHLGDVISSSEYTSNINNLKTPGGKQRHNFFGLVLSGNTISRAYACILKENKIYCIEGSTNGAYHNSNIAILNKIFTSDQCRTISDGHTYTCTDGSYNGDTKTNGYTSLHYETSCTIYGANSRTGELVCH